MKEQILELLKRENRAFSIYEINDDLNYKTVDEFKEVLKALNELEDELKVYRTNKDKYMLFNNSNLKLGTMLATKKSYGFVDIEGDEDVFIPPLCMNNAIHGDKVVVEITSKKGTSLEGRIVRIVDRKLKQMVGEFCYKDGKPSIVLDDEKVKINVVLEKEQIKDLVEGHKVLIKLTSKLKDNNYNTFVELLVDIAKSNEINTRQMEILIKLQFFQEFGNNKKLLKIYELFNKVYGKKQISKNKLLEYELDENLVRKYATKESDTNYYMEGSKKDIIYLAEKPARFKTGEKAVWMKENAKEVQFYGLLPNKPVLSRLAPITRCYNTKTSRMIEMLKEIEQNMPNETFSIRQQIEYEKEYAGYISMTYNVDKSYCYVLDVDFKYSPKIKLYSLGSGKETWCKVNKNTFAKSPFGIGTVLNCIKFEKRPRYMKTENGFEKTEEKEWWLNVYEPLEDDEINKILEGGK